ncbi:hypothetical protein DNTS_017963 [Danionella cerebrum]|uniref:Uncharacterized protein n=1 Tax=Danionella cerebrum TaxID=2873325 RepID=A0A553R8B5_9TELE|nr:hypothetical protein DNTS_017963 [Danionella translucida]
MTMLTNTNSFVHYDSDESLGDTRLTPRLGQGEVKGMWSAAQATEPHKAISMKIDTEHRASVRYGYTDTFPFVLADSNMKFWPRWKENAQSRFTERESKSHSSSSKILNVLLRFHKHVEKKPSVPLLLDGLELLSCAGGLQSSVYSEQTILPSTSANIDYRNFKHLKELLKQTEPGRRENDLESRLVRLFLTGVSSSELLSSSSETSDCRSSTMDRSGPKKQKSLTSDLEEASSSELDSSDSGGFFGSLASWASDLPLAQRPFSFELFFSPYPDEAVEEEAVRGEVPLNPPLPFDPSELPFFGFLTLGLGDSALEARLLAVFPSAAPPPPPTPPPFGDMLSILDSFSVNLGSLKAALGTTLLSSFNLSLDDEDEDEGSRLLLLLLSRSVSPLDGALLSESFRGRSLCSLAILWGLETLLPSLLGSYKK